MDMEYMDILRLYFSKLLYYKRIELHLSQEEMAERCCISLRQYVDIENGKRLPSFMSLVNMRINGGLDFDVFIEEILKAGYVPVDNINPKK